MSDKTKIEWTDSTWNPITGCTLVSEGCRNCYAAELAATRLQHHPSREGLATRNKAGVAKFTGEVRLNTDWLDQPLRWRKPSRIFVCAHGDLFHESVPDDWIDKVFAVMALAPQHQFQVLTKRPERMRDYLRSDSRTWAWYKENRRADPEYREGSRFEYGELPYDYPLPNVWLGVSVEDQKTANERIPHLLQTPAAVRFLSCEPLLGPVDLEHIGNALFDRKAAIRRCINGPAAMNWDQADASIAYPEIDWVIVGGESGRHARPMHPDWARGLRDQCAAAGVPFFFKQWGEWTSIYDRDQDDPDWRRCDDIALKNPKGRWLNRAGGHGFHGDRVCYVTPVGKSLAGRELDGQTHNAMPDGGKHA